MTGTDLLCAIAQADKKYVHECEQFSVIADSIKAERHRNRQRLAFLGIAAVLCITVFGTVRSLSQRIKRFSPSASKIIQTPDRNPPSDLTVPLTDTESGSSGREDDSPIPSGNQVSATEYGTAYPEASTENREQQKTTNTTNLPETSIQTPLTDIPSSGTITDAPTAPSVEPSSAVPSTILNPEEPQNAYQDVSVDHQTARAYFLHPIIPCTRKDFTGYSVLLVKQNGRTNASETTCLSVTYLFTNGSVALRDQSKTGEITPTGKQTEYRGRTFYVHTPEFNGDMIRIGFYPTGKTGIAYQAHFNSSSDMNEIMDLILSLEL